MSEYLIDNLRDIIESKDAEVERARVLLTKLSNEAGACSGMTGAREFLGNTNLACLELRVREAREWLASIDAARAADSAQAVVCGHEWTTYGIGPTTCRYCRATSETVNGDSAGEKP
jgi:hypothetical protein